VAETSAHPVAFSTMLFDTPLAFWPMKMAFVADVLDAPAFVPTCTESVPATHLVVSQKR
jgi:hypothetical protein